MDKTILRQMAWERAKGELNSMLVTYVGEESKFEVLKKTIDAFIKDVEDNGKQE